MGEKKVEVIRRISMPATPVVVKDKELVKSEIVSFLNIIIKNTLSQPDNAKITMEEGGKTTIFEVDFAHCDFGRFVGAKGKTVGALRALVSGMAAAHGFRAIIRIKDEDRFF